MPDFLDMAGFMPHGHCYFWQPAVVGVFAVSDSLIAIAYLVIGAALGVLAIRGRREIPYRLMFLAFGIFIFACGGTHVMDVWTIWEPRYGLSAAIRVITAAASVATAWFVPPLVPRVLYTVRMARLADERKVALERAHAELERAHARLREFDQIKTQFFANVSHELRTPLALVLGPVERMVDAPNLTEAQRRDLEVVARNARLLLRHVNDLLDVSRLEAGRMPVRYARVDLARRVRLVAGHFEAIAQERRMDYAVDTPDALPAEVDVDKVDRVLLNLLSNAFKFTPEGGRVRCSLGEAEGRAILMVEDSGPGIPEDQRELVFERFRQLHAGDARQFGGTGLGLAIAREFVVLHGGSIAVDGSPLGGARFTVTLPRTAPVGTPVEEEIVETDRVTSAVVQQAIEGLRPEAEPTPPPEGGGEGTVLVVEDNPELRRFLAEGLAPRYRVATAPDGAAGLEVALDLRPDIVVTDVMMPRMSGTEMLRHLRMRAELDGVPVIVLTARADDELRVRMLREGAQDYVIKPFSIDELRARVDNLVAIKRARDVLQRELETRTHDLATLARELAARKRELHSALDAMRAARDLAESASRIKSEFLRLVSHELRTPLASIAANLAYLVRDPTGSLSDRQRQAAQRIERSASRLLELVNAILEYARIESDRITVHPEAFDPMAVAHDVRDELLAPARQKDLDLQVIAQGDVPPLRSDPRLFRLILSSLCGNAVKYTERGFVEMALSVDRGRLRVDVRDSGPGIPEEARQRIFEPFEQLVPPQHKQVPGLGLGLALVRSIVQALGGEIHVQSEVGVGSTFTVWVPDLPAGEEAEAPPPGPEPRA